MTTREWNAELERRVDQLTAASIDGRITPAEQAELGELLAAHPEARTAFLTQMDVEAMLRAREYRAGQTLSFDQAGQPAGAARGSSPAPGTRGWGWTAAAAMLIAALGVAGAWWGSKPRMNPPLAGVEPQVLGTLTESASARWGEDQGALLGSQGVGQEIGLGRLSLTAGTARIITTSQVALTLQAPCLVEFLNPRTIKVHHGRITAKVNGDSAIGFRVQTPTADVVDLGTEFGVLVERDGSSEVHVFQGVVVARPLGAELVVPLYRNEAGRVAREDRTARDGEQMNLSRPASLLAVAARPELFGQQPAEIIAQPASGHQPLPRDARVLFIGDSFLDDGTSLLLVEQAWHNAGWTPAPRLINGFVPDWIHQHTQRLEHHVFRFRPTHVVISFGPQYAWLPADRIPAEKFGADLTTLVETLTARGIEPILATAYRFRAVHTEQQQVLDGYNAQVRRVAGAKGLRLADLDRRFREVETLVDALVDANGRLATFASEQLIAATWLEAFGQRDLAVPERLDLPLLPGVVADWQFQLLPQDRPPLTAESVAQLTPGADWQPLHLPQVDRFTPRLAEPSHSPVCRERGLGFATHLTTHLLPIWRGVATKTCSAEQNAYLHVGGGIRQVWINGELAFDEQTTYPAGHGYHVGFESAPVRLRAGENRIVMECSGAFFISLTESADPPRREF